MYGIKYINNFSPGGFRRGLIYAGGYGASHKMRPNFMGELIPGVNDNLSAGSLVPIYSIRDKSMSGVIVDGGSYNPDLQYESDIPIFILYKGSYEWNGDIFNAINFMSDYKSYYLSSGTRYEMPEGSIYFREENISIRPMYNNEYNGQVLSLPVIVGYIDKNIFNEYATEEADGAKRLYYYLVYEHYKIGAQYNSTNKEMSFKITGPIIFIDNDHLISIVNGTSETYIKTDYTEPYNSQYNIVNWDTSFKTDEILTFNTETAIASIFDYYQVMRTSASERLPNYFMRANPTSIVGQVDEINEGLTYDFNTTTNNFTFDLIGENWTMKTPLLSEIHRITAESPISTALSYKGTYN